MFGSRYLDNGPIDFKRRVYSFGKEIHGHFSSCVTQYTLVLFDSENWCSNDPTVSTHYINGWYRFFSKTTKDSNPQVYTSITPEGIYIFTGNDVISYFPSAANGVHTTANVTDFTVTKWSFCKISETVKASILKHLPPHSPGYSLYFDWKWRHNMLPLGSKSHKRVNIGSYWVSISRKRLNRFITGLLL